MPPAICVERRAGVNGCLEVSANKLPVVNYRGKRGFTFFLQPTAQVRVYSTFPRSGPPPSFLRALESPPGGAVSGALSCPRSRVHGRPDDGPLPTDPAPSFPEVPLRIHGVQRRRSDGGECACSGGGGGWRRAWGRSRTRKEKWKVSPPELRCSPQLVARSWQNKQPRATASDGKGWSINSGFGWGWVGGEKNLA